jgi:hypothetical protein
MNNETLLFPFVVSPDLLPFLLRSGVEREGYEEVTNNLRSLSVSISWSHMPDLSYPEVHVRRPNTGTLHPE